MKYLLRPDSNRIWIDTREGYELGHVDLPCEGFPVRAPDGELIADVKSLKDALPAILDYWEKERRLHHEREIACAKRASFVLLTKR